MDGHLPSQGNKDTWISDKIDISQYNKKLSPLLVSIHLMMISINHHNQLHPIRELHEGLQHLLVTLFGRHGTINTNTVCFGFQEDMLPL